MDPKCINAMMSWAKAVVHLTTAPKSSAEEILAGKQTRIWFVIAKKYTAIGRQL